MLEISNDLGDHYQNYFILLRHKDNGYMFLMHSGVVIIRVIVAKSSLEVGIGHTATCAKVEARL